MILLPRILLARYDLIPIFWTLVLKCDEVPLFILIVAGYPLISIHFDAASLYIDWLLYQVDK